MEHSSKEYYEKQSEFWFNEASKFVKQRDELIEDLARVREERDDYKEKLDKVVDLFVNHINYKLAIAHNQWYINLRHKLDAIAYSEKENR